MKDVAYKSALLLQLLTMMIPFMPSYTAYASMVLFVAYLMVKGVYVDKAYMRWMLVVFGFFSLSAVWAINWKVSAYKLVYDLLPIYVAMAASYTFMKKSPNALKSILWIYIIASGFLILYMIFNLGDIRAMVEGERLGTILNENAGVEDGTETKFNSNVIGMNLCYTLYAGYVLLFKNSKSFIKQVVLLPAAVVIIYLIMVTGSRKALVLLLLPFVVFPLLNRNRGKTMLILPVSLGLVIGTYYLIMNVPVLYEILGTRVEEFFNIVSGTETGTEDVSRLFLIEYGLEWFKENPIFGYGINNFRVLSNNTELFAGRNFYAHNNYIELLVGVGIVGTLIYYSCYFYFWKRLRKTTSGNMLRSWVVVLIVAALFLDFASVSYYGLIHNLILCICFYAVGKDAKQNGRLATQKKYKYETGRHHPAL